MDTRNVLASLQTVADVKLSKEAMDSDLASLIKDKNRLISAYGIPEEEFIGACYDIYRVVEVWRQTEEDKDMTLSSRVKNIMIQLEKNGSFKETPLIHFDGAKDIILKWVCWELMHPDKPLICNNTPFAVDLLGLTPERFRYLCSTLMPISKNTQDPERLIMSMVKKIHKQVAIFYDPDSMLGHSIHYRVMHKDIIYYAFAKEIVLQLRQKKFVQTDVSGQLLMQLMQLRGIFIGKNFFPPMTDFFQQPFCISDSKPVTGPLADLCGVTPAGLKTLCMQSLRNCAPPINIFKIDQMIKNIILSLTSKNGFYKSKQFKCTLEHHSMIYQAVVDMMENIVQVKGLDDVLRQYCQSTAQASSDSSSMPVATTLPMVDEVKPSLDENEFILKCYEIYRVAECWTRSNQVSEMTPQDIVKSTMQKLLIMPETHPTLYPVFLEWVCWELKNPTAPLILKNRPSATDLLGITLDKFNSLCGEMVEDGKLLRKKDEEAIIKTLLYRIRKKISHLFGNAPYQALGHPKHLHVMYKDIILKAMSIEIARLLRENGILDEDVSGELFVKTAGMRLLLHFIQGEDLPTADTFFQQSLCTAPLPPEEEAIAAIFGVTGLLLKKMCNDKMAKITEPQSVSRIMSLLDMIMRSLTSRNQYYQSKDFKPAEQVQHKNQLFNALAVQAVQMLKPIRMRAY